MELTDEPTLEQRIADLVVKRKRERPTRGHGYYLAEHFDDRCAYGCCELRHQFHLVCGDWDEEAERLVKQYVVRAVDGHGSEIFYGS